MADTLAQSYANLSLSSAGAAAERAASNKMSKYTAITVTHDFVPIALETLGPFSKTALDFLIDLGRRLSVATGDRREGSFLFQRLSIALQRFNSVAFRDSFVVGEAGDQ